MSVAVYPTANINSTKVKLLFVQKKKLTQCGPKSTDVSRGRLRSEPASLRVIRSINKEAVGSQR